MTKWRIVCGNSFVDGVYSDFTDDAEAAQYAADYEGVCYRITPDGGQTLIYQPDEWAEGGGEYG